MINNVKNWLIPHSGNKQHPHAIRPLGLLILGLLILLAQVTYNLTTSGQYRVLGYASDVYSGDLIEATNREREKHNLQPLYENPKLSKAAELKARHMIENDYWAHIAPDGTKPWDFFEEADYKYIFAGENLAKGFNTSKGVMAGWMNSEGHRANILNSQFLEIGIASIDGVLGGEETTLVVAHYARSANQTEGLEIHEGGSIIINENGVAILKDPETAPTAKELGIQSPFIFIQSMGWGQLFAVTSLSAITPVYLLTHIKMIKRRIHKSKPRLFQRKFLEFSLLLLLVGSLLLSFNPVVG